MGKVLAEQDPEFRSHTRPHKTPALGHGDRLGRPGVCWPARLAKMMGVAAGDKGI